MDPDQALENIRELAHTVQGPSLSHETVSSLAFELGLAIEVLDAWLTQGGYLPQPWAQTEDGSMVPQ